MQELSLDLEKYPHLIEVQKRANELTLYIEKLNKRKVLLNNQQAIKNEFERNEDEILLIKTDWELAKSHKNLAEKTEYIREFIDRLQKYIPEINENYTAMLEKANNYLANNLKSKNNELVKALKTEFEEVSKTDLNENWEVRIKHYLVLKNLFENSKKSK